MFDQMLRRLMGGSSDKKDILDENDARRALAALLVRVARSDAQYLPEEKARIDRILAQRYALSPFEATKLRGDAEEIEAAAPDTVRFTRAIKDAVPLEAREGIVEALWAVALADGARDPEEDALLRLVANLLGINDRDNARARQRADRQS